MSLQLGLSLRIGFEGIIAALSSVITTGLKMWHSMTSSGVSTVGSGSAEFNGTTSKIIFGDVAGLSFDKDDAFSVSFWFKTDTTSNDSLISKRNSSSPYDGWEIEMLSGNLYFQLINTATTNQIRVITTGTFNDGLWHHAVVVYDGSSNASGVNWYVDNIMVSDTDAIDNLTTSISNSFDFSMGQRGGSANPFEGELTKVGIWSRALSGSEVKSIMAKTYSGLSDSEKTNVVSWYELESDSTDSHGSNDGTDTSISYVDATPFFRQLADSSDDGNNLLLHTGRGFSSDGVNDYIDIGDTSQTVKSITAFIKPATTTEKVIDFDGGTHVLELSAGTLTATGFSTPTLYVDGVAGSTIIAGVWQFIAVTTATGFSANDLDFFRDGATYGELEMCDVKLYDTELSPNNVLNQFQNPEQVTPDGISDSNLVGWWPLADGEGAGIVLDGSTNRNYGTISGASEIFGLPLPVPQVAVLGNNKGYFVGNDEYIQSSSDLSLTNTGDYLEIKIILTGDTANYIMADITGGNDYLNRATDTIRISATNYIVPGMSNSFNHGQVNTVRVTKNASDFTVTVNGSDFTVSSTGTFSISAIGSWFGIGGGEDMIVLSADLYKSGSQVGYWTASGNFKDEVGSNDFTKTGGNEILLTQGTGINKDILGETLLTKNEGYLILNGDGYGVVKGDATLDIVTAITLEAWVKVVSFPTTQSTILRKDTAYLLDVNGASNYFRFGIWDSSSFNGVSDVTPISIDTWYHVAGTYDGSTLRLYVDGAEVNTASYSGNIDTSSNDLYVGQTGSGVSYLDGIIDSPKVYNSALSANDILGNYNAEKSNYQ